MKEIRIGMIGYGSMGHVHQYAVECQRYFYPHREYRATIVGLCARSEATRKEAEASGIGYTTSCEDDLIYRDDIDAIDICTPNIAHYETAKKAILAGKAVYLEKPMTVTYARAKELAELAEEKGVTAQVVFNTRFLPAIRRAKELCEAGAVGRVISFRSAYLHASCTDPEKKAGWKQNRDICGGGVWFDLGSHAVDLLTYLCGKVKTITGKAQIGYPVRRGMDGQTWQTNADEAFYAIAELENGACGTFEANKLATGANDDFTLEIYGEKGALRFSLMDPNFLEYYDATRPAGAYGGERGFCRIECVGRIPDAYPMGGQKAPVGWLRGHIDSYRAFLESVAHHTQPSPSFWEGAEVQRVLEEAYREAEK